MDQGAGGGHFPPAAQHGIGAVLVVFIQAAQVLAQAFQAPALVGQRLSRFRRLAVQGGEQGAHLPAVLAAHLETVLAGQARHQHRRLAGHVAQPLAVAVHQRRRHRQARRRQGRQQRQIGRQGLAVELLEHGQDHRPRAAVLGPGVDQEGAVLNAVARRLRVLQPQRVVGQQGGQIPIIDTGIDGHQHFLVFNAKKGRG